MLGLFSLREWLFIFGVKIAHISPFFRQKAFKIHNIDPRLVWFGQQ
jgi:hypothetical protein